MVDEESFLRRWSRRKRERAEEAPRVAPGQDARPASAPARPVSDARGVPAVAPPPQPPDLPSLDSLQGLASDYSEFLKPAVDEDLRRSALKKLFHDPHFNVMDGLDVYIDDYSKPDPIPESMLKDLLARHAGFFDPAEKPADGEADTRVAEAPQAAVEPPAPDASTPDSAPAAIVPEAAARPEDEKP
jgi:hypothetical protein